MCAKVILANPEAGIYAAHIKANERMAVFQLVEGPAIRVGDMISAVFTYPGDVLGRNPYTQEIFSIRIVLTGVSLSSASRCVEDPFICLQ